ncbi:hypothetical protein BJ508DRAFT_304609 [Ascobolus immersus RN42]|uniref:Uncharacterized protein n=1 Tax=Ascobolus immersus RN42 TaxID=1160509 RepID=A0A3N4IBE2_ASCIM|nr:hypothetical protein BJ508DRAFT_304609 [Ascobolus immersus RN42]
MSNIDAELYERPNQPSPIPPSRVALKAPPPSTYIKEYLTSGSNVSTLGLIYCVAMAFVAQPFTLSAEDERIWLLKTPADELADRLQQNPSKAMALLHRRERMNVKYNITTRRNNAIKANGSYGGTRRFALPCREIDGAIPRNGLHELRRVARTMVRNHSSILFDSNGGNTESEEVSLSVCGGADVAVIRSAFMVSSVVLVGRVDSFPSKKNAGGGYYPGVHAERLGRMLTALSRPQVQESHRIVDVDMSESPRSIHNNNTSEGDYRNAPVRIGSGTRTQGMATRALRSSSRQETAVAESERATTPETTHIGSQAQMTPRQMTPRQMTPRQMTPRQMTPRQGYEVVVSPRTSVRNSIPKSSPPGIGSVEWTRETYQQPTTTHDGNENEEEGSDLDFDIEELDKFAEAAKADEGRQARIEAEYNAQKEKDKVHWCRMYSTAALLVQKGDKPIRMTWKSQHKYWMRLFCHKHQWYGKTPYKGHNRDVWAKVCAREMAGCNGKKRKCSGMVVKIQNFLDNYGRALRSAGRIRQAFANNRPVKNGERVVSNQHIRDMSLVDLLQNKYDLNSKEDLSRVLAMLKHCAASRGEDVPLGHPMNYLEVQSLSFSWEPSDVHSGSDLAAEHIDCYENLIDAQFPLADEDGAELAHLYEDCSEMLEDSEPEEQDTSVKSEAPF